MSMAHDMLMYLASASHQCTWHRSCACRQRFSLLFYGFGSKRGLLEAFAEEALTDGGVLACDGLAPGINAKQASL